MPRSNVSTEKPNIFLDGSECVVCFEREQTQYIANNCAYCVLISCSGRVYASENEYATFKQWRAVEDRGFKWPTKIKHKFASFKVFPRQHNNRVNFSARLPTIKLDTTAKRWKSGDSLATLSHCPCDVAGISLCGRRRNLSPVNMIARL